MRQTLRSVYHAPTTAERRRRAGKVLASFPSCPILEVARLGRTLRSWRAEFLAYFDTGRASNGPTEAINLQVEKIRRTAHGFRNFRNYRLRLLLYAESPGTLPARHISGPAVYAWWRRPRKPLR